MRKDDFTLVPRFFVKISGVATTKKDPHSTQLHTGINIVGSAILNLRTTLSTFTCNLQPQDLRTHAKLAQK